MCQSHEPRRLSRRSLLKAGLGTVGAVGVLGVGGLTALTATRFNAGDAHQGELVLRGGRVLLGPELEPVEDAHVVIRDGVITEAGRGISLPEGAAQLDVAGATLLPGLIDLHVHLGFPELERGEEMGPGQIPGMVWDAIRHVPDARRALLAHGVTSVRSLGDEHAWVTELRRLVADGELEGPRVFAAGPVFTTPEGHPIVTFGTGPDSDSVRVPQSAEHAAAMVTELAEGPSAVDCVKVIQERGDPERLVMPPHEPAVLDAIVGAAHDHGLPVIAHWGTAEDLADVLEAGVDGLEHVEARGLLAGWPDGALDDLIRQGTPLTPTLAVTEVAVPDDTHAHLRNRVAEFNAAGGTVVAGSDAAVPGVGFGSGLVRELELLVTAGLSPVEALQAATVRAAGVLRSQAVGVIEPGRASDLLAVRGDPLADISAVREVQMVLRDGRVVVDNRE